MHEYMKIRQYVIDKIRKHPSTDERIMSERELCKKFSVTRPTVRYALKGLIDDGYLCVRHGVGMFINPEKSRNYGYAYRKSYTVMVIVANGRHADIDGFYMAMLEQVFHVFRSLPINLRITDLDTSDAEDAIPQLSSHEVDAILWIWPESQSWKIIKRLQKDRLVYTVGDAPMGIRCHVTADYEKAGYLAASWFIRNGRKRIGFVGAVRDSAVRNVFYQGWQMAFKEAGIPFDEKRVVALAEDVPERIRELVCGEEIEGIYTFGSEYVIVDTILKQEGVSPDRCPVIMEENYFGVYGAINQPAARLMTFLEVTAKEAAQQLFKSLQDPEYRPEEMVLAPEIILPC